MNVLKVGAALVALCAGNAWATAANASEWYAFARVGQSEAAVEGIELNEGLAYGAGVGTAVGPFRVEAGVDRLSGDFSGIFDVDALDYNATAYLDLAVGDNASIFAGAGIDYVSGQGSVPGFSIDADGTGYHYAVGGAYRLSPGVIAEVQYRHIEADMSADFIGDFSAEADVVSAGVRFAL